jgi:hypothetical protein
MTRSSHSERKRKELRGGNRERMAECNAMEAFRRYEYGHSEERKGDIREQLGISN